MRSSLRILIVEDDPTSQLMIKGALESAGHQASVVDSGEEAIRIMSSESPPEIVLLDWELPGIKGDEVCQKLRDQSLNTSSPYIIFVTARSTSRAAIKALEHGASDFIRKPFNRGELLARVMVGERALLLQKDLEQAEQKMAQLAVHDSLTGLYNRRAMIDLLHKKIARAQRDHSELALALADLDYFKQINDQHGHLTGDQVLQLFANSVQMKLRSSESLARWGGEEFLLLFPYRKSEEGPEKLLQRLHSIQIDYERNSRIFTPERPFTVSMGVIFSDGSDQLDVIIKSAEDALYAAKNRGRNHICWKPNPEELKIEDFPKQGQKHPE